MLSALACSHLQHTTQNWKTDAEFARQFLSGVNPVLITGCKALPEVFKPTALEQQRIAAVAGGKTLAELIQEKRLFYVDYEVLEHIDMGQNRVFYAPVILLYLQQT